MITRLGREVFITFPTKYHGGILIVFVLRDAGATNAIKHGSWQAIK